MPATSERQRRFFGAVVALKRGKLKGASAELKKAAKSVSDADAADFARRTETAGERRARLRASEARRRVKGGK